MTETISPGQFLREKIEGKGWTQSDLAYAIGTKPSAINQILADKRSVSHNMARALGVALDFDPIWIAKVQAEWDLASAAEPDPSVAARSKILSKYPLREMTKRGWVDPEHGQGALEEQVCRFFGVQSLDEVPHLKHSAKKTNYDDGIPPAQLAWLYRVRKIASEMQTPAYSKQKLQDAISELSTLRAQPDGVRHVPRALQDAGVRFVVVEGLPNSKIDGVCFWLDAHSPVIGMSMRFDRVDNFWFVFRHECAHVLHGHGREAAILDVDLDGNDASSVSEEERVANAEASDFCVPAKKMDSFYLRKKPYFAEREVLAFAKRIETHPGMVVGQLQRRMGRYDFLRKHLVKVRETLAMAMMMDGWGDSIPTER